jgi:hypothetical protein
MTRDEMIKLAREAGLIPPPLDWPQKYAEALERFAALVAEAERERIKKINAPVIQRINEHLDILRARGEK